MTLTWPESGLRTSVQTCALRKWRWEIILLLVVAAAVYLGTSAWPVILDETDGQYAGAAREMLDRGDWLVPTNDGVPRLQKPPLVYWLTRFSLQALGVNEFAARLPNALATLAWIFATYLLGERVGGYQRGVFGAAIFASLFGLFLFAHRIMPEPFLGACISLTIWCFLSALKQPECARRWFVGAWIFMGLGVLSKGLHGALYPLVIAGITAWAFPQTRKVWRGMAPWAGITAFLAITVPWYAAMTVRFPGFLVYHFFSEQAGHAFNTAAPRDCDPVPFWLFWGQHLFFLFPWILFLPATIWTLRKQRNTGPVEFSGETILWIWILVTAVSISFSVRQDHYLMSVWGAVAICLALPWLSQRPPPARWLACPCVAIAVVGGILVILAFILSQPFVVSAASVKPEAARGDIHSAMQGLSIGAWRSFSLLAGATGLTWLVSGLASAVLVRRGQRTAAVWLLAAAMALIFPIATRGYARVQDYFSLADAAVVINRTAQAGALVVCEGEPHLSASLFFYLDRRVCWAGPRAGSELALHSRQMGIAESVTDQELARLWHSPRQVFFILEASNLPEWRQKILLKPWQEIPAAQSGTRMLLVNQR